MGRVETVNNYISVNCKIINFFSCLNYDRESGKSGGLIANYNVGEIVFMEASESEERDKSDYKSAVNGKTSLNKQLKRVFFLWPAICGAMMQTQ